jgi:hypothetical protein
VRDDFVRKTWSQLTPGEDFIEGGIQGGMEVVDGSAGRYAELVTAEPGENVCVAGMDIREQYRQGRAIAACGCTRCVEEQVGNATACGDHDDIDARRVPRDAGGFPYATCVAD